MSNLFIQLQVRKGLEVDLPTLAIGEFGFCTDSKKLFVGTGSGNELLNNKYVPSTPADWTGSPPSTISSALDRLVTVVAVLNGGPV